MGVTYKLAEVIGKSVTNLTLITTCLHIFVMKVQKGAYDLLSLLWIHKILLSFLIIMNLRELGLGLV